MTSYHYKQRSCFVILFLKLLQNIITSLHCSTKIDNKNGKYIKYCCYFKSSLQKSCKRSFDNLLEDLATLVLVVFSYNTHQTIGQDFFAFGQKLETFLKRYRNCKLSTNPAHIAKQTVMFVIAQTLHRVKIAWNSTKMDLKSMAFILSLIHI